MSISLKRIFVILLTGVLLVSAFYYSKWGFRKPSRYHGIKKTFDISKNLRKHVDSIAVSIPSKNKGHVERLKATAEYIKKELITCGYKPEMQDYTINSQKFSNVIAYKQGSIPETIVIGAHYDTYFNPGADDNSSGVAVLLETAKTIQNIKEGYSVIFAAFANEEPPNFKTENMGSYVFVKSLKDKNTVIQGAVILESVGYYSEKSNSQTYPPLLGFFYPNKGDFLAIVSNFKSKKLAHKVNKAFDYSVTLPVSRLVSFDFVPGVDFSDNWSFWKANYPAVMLTDTAFFRNSKYHTAGDLPDTLNYTNMADIVLALGHLISKGSKFTK